VVEIPILDISDVFAAVGCDTGVDGDTVTDGDIDAVVETPIQDISGAFGAAN